MLETLKSQLRKFFNFIKPRSKLGLASFIFCLTFAVFCFVIFTPAVHANVVADALAEWFARIVLFFAGLFMQLAIFFLKFVIEIAAYNGYINSAPVQLGWSLVRDIANMFFVVILLIIAFATVLGLENYSWKKLLMKFVLAAILVNFSRIICGVIIDAAQVFMMTFVNGVAATAGGNLTQALKLESILSFSSSADPEGMTNVNILGTAMAATFFAALSAFTIGAYLVMLLIRVVVLWVLIILSPFAFVLNVVPKTQAYAGKWWNSFGNEVITGPVLVFFLWLAFAVAGSGNLHNELEKENPYSLSSSIEQIRSETESVTNQNLAAGGLGEILEWENMAGFIIAASMLLIGVKITKELSTVGGGIMGGIVDFGKRAATVATGVAAARYLARGAAQGVGRGVTGAAKFAGMKFGGAYFQNLGIAAKDRVQAGLKNWEVARDKRATKLDEYAAKEGGIKGFFARRAAGVVQSGFYARKKAETWSSAVEHLKAVQDAYTSTSKTAGGKFKDEVATRRYQAEDFVQKKIRQKAAENRAKLLQTKEGKEKEELIMETELKGEGAEARLKGEQEAALAERRRQRMAEPAVPDSKAETYQAQMRAASGFGARKKIADLEVESRKKLYDRDAMDAYKEMPDFKTDVGRMLGLTAEAEQRALMSDRSTEAAVAGAKDDYLEENTGARGNFERQVRAKHTKEDVERISAGSFDRALAQASILGEQLNPSTQIDPDKLDKIKKSGADIILSNFQRGSVFALNAMDNYFKTSGFKRHNVTADASEENQVAQQANLMTSLLGRQVDNDKTAVKEAFEDLRESKGDAFMEELSRTVGEVGNDASNTFAGLMKESKDTDGKVKVLPLDFTKNEGDIKGKREYAMTRSKLGNEGLAGSVDKIEGDLRIMSEQAKQNIGTMFESVTPVSYGRIDKNPINDMAEAIINAQKAHPNNPEAARSEIRGIVEALAQGINDKRGYETMLAGIQKSLENKGATNIEIPKVEHKPEKAKGAAKAKTSESGGGTPPPSGGTGGGTSGGASPRDKGSRAADRSARNIDTREVDRALKQLADTFGKLGTNVDKIFKDNVMGALDNARDSGAKVDAEALAKEISKKIASAVGGGTNQKELGETIARAIGEMLRKRERVADRRKQAKDRKVDRDASLT